MFLPFIMLLTVQVFPALSKPTRRTVINLNIKTYCIINKVLVQGGVH